VDLPTRNLIRKKQEENPLLGEWRMYAALKQLGISVSPRTCGRIMAENRRLYAIKPKPGEPHKPKPHPFKATARHERWCLDIRYIEKHRIPEIKGSFYVITIMDAFSRAILSSDIFQSQDLSCVLIVLYAAIEQFGAPKKLITDNGRIEHGKQGCESCHGPSKNHVESGGDVPPPISFSRKSKTPVAERNATCLNCHEKTARTLWKGSTHESRNVACTDCHTVMRATSERGNLKQQTVVETCANCHAQKKAQLARFSHMPLGEGKMECTSCHNPHGSANDKMLLASSVNETCFSCHAEKRGPFLFEHEPVRENCDKLPRSARHRD
jgi:DmsE family decaheme c-type cytochrome